MPSFPTHPGDPNDSGASPPSNASPPSTPGQFLLDELLGTGIVLSEDWEAMPDQVRTQLNHCSSRSDLVGQLVGCRLLTEYQSFRILAGKMFGLMLGNYRILECLGAGGMGVVYKGEHRDLRRPVAIKVLPLTRGQDPRALRRFSAEMRAIAQLQHPNIVSAMDAGTVRNPADDVSELRYFVMEYIPGENLETRVVNCGPFAPGPACELFYQVASALAEAHKHDLVHRDIKPSNILITPEGQAKLLDFGLVRHHRQHLTDVGVVLGTVDFMAPEQAGNASAVDGRADLYSLGATLFWCLTGQLPFPSRGSVLEDLAQRLDQAPPSVRTWRLDVPSQLDDVITRLMALKPDDRYPTAQAVMRALLPFLRPDMQEQHIRGVRSLAEPALSQADSTQPRAHCVLIVDDEPEIRRMCRTTLQGMGLACDEAAHGGQALEAVAERPFDLILLDINMPELSGTEVLHRLREAPPCPHLKIIMFSGRATADEMAQMMLAGADDYLTKPFSLVQLLARIKTALRLKDAQDHSDQLNRHLLGINAGLETHLTARDIDLVHARNALVLALAKLVEQRDSEPGAHLLRLQRYSRQLAEEAADVPSFATQIDENFIHMLEGCAPLHDIGKVGLPDFILLKPGPLTADERILMQTHTTIGADTLLAVSRQNSFARPFLRMAIDIARHHHERWDGTGYPDRLTGEGIPLAARLVALGDVYDALRSRRVYKPALAHETAVQMMIADRGHFDPALVPIFHRSASQLERIYRELVD